MTFFSRRAALAAAGIVVAIGLAVGLAACGDNEPEQRKAFVEFLQTQIVNRSGVHVPRLNATDTKKFGDYVKHYAVITDFVGDPEMTALGQKMAQGLPALNSMQNVIDQRATIRKVGAEMGELIRALDQRFAKAKADRDTLKQPDDLKTVYDAAFTKVVAAPVAAFREAVPIAQTIAVAAADIGDYVASHASTVKVVGNNLQATNAKARAEVDALIKALSSQTAGYNEAQRKLRAVLQGN